MPDRLLDSEKAELLIRITKFVGERFEEMTGPAGIWKQREIHEAFGIPGPRQTMYSNYDKYNRRITLKDLALCVGGGIVSVKELIENCAEAEKEMDFIETTFGILENQPLREVIIKLKSVGIDPVNVLEKALADYEAETEKK